MIARMPYGPSYLIRFACATAAAVDVEATAGDDRHAALCGFDRGLHDGRAEPG